MAVRQIAFSLTFGCLRAANVCLCVTNGEETCDTVSSFIPKICSELRSIFPAPDHYASLAGQRVIQSAPQLLCSILRALIRQQLQQEVPMPHVPKVDLERAMSGWIVSLLKDV